MTDRHMEAGGTRALVVHPALRSAAASSRSLEARLAEAGVVAQDALDAEPSPDELAASAADREAFVAHLMSNLLGEQVSKGAR